MAQPKLSSIIEPLVLRTELRESTWDPDELSALSGGYILRVGAEALPPSCCGDLGTLREWALAAESTDETWQMFGPATHGPSFAARDEIYVTALSERSTTENLVVKFCIFGRLRLPLDVCR